VLLLGVGLGLAAGCAPTTARTESDVDTCSNGRDDDGDTLVDCRDPACTLFPYCSADAGTDAGTDAPIGDAAGLDAADAPPSCVQPLDVVVVLDVSSTMDAELTAIEAALPAVWDRAHVLDPGATFSLVVFVDDVLVVNGCTPFGSAADLVASIEAFRLTAPMNRNVANTTLANRDCPENSLDALFDAATECSYRSGSARVILHATDDTFVERPGVLSGEWGGGIFVESTYAEVVTALVSRGIHLGTLAWSGVGLPCGAGMTTDTGAGFFGPWQDTMAAIPMATSGAVWDARSLGTSDLSGDMNALLNRVHDCGATR
jgi:hypothetical protein